MVAILAACAPLSPKTAMRASWKTSPNFDGRRPNLVIIHHTGNPTLEQALHTLTSPERKVSSHYLIGRDGAIFQLVEDHARAWHAGKSWWGGFTDINSVSLGIELDNNGHEPFADTQIEALLTLLADIKSATRFLGPISSVMPMLRQPGRMIRAPGFPGNGWLSRVLACGVRHPCRPLRSASIWRSHLPPSAMTRARRKLHERLFAYISPVRIRHFLPNMKTPWLSVCCSRSALQARDAPTEGRMRAQASE